MSDDTPEHTDEQQPAASPPNASLGLIESGFGIIEYIN